MTCSSPNFESICCSTLVPTVASNSEYRFLRRQVRWSDIPISLRILHRLCDLHKGFDIVDKAEVDVFLEFLCFLYDPANATNLISCSSAFSKPSLYIWKFLIDILLKPSLKDLEHILTSMGNEHNCMVVEHSLALPFFGIGMKTGLFQSCDHC